MDLLTGRATSLRGPLAVAIVTVALGCASRGERETARAEPPARSSPAATREDGGDERDAAPAPPPREISTDRANAADPGAGTPERSSSQRLVEEGKGYLIAGQPGQAASRLERATRIDPTNGFAYYHLGRAKAAMGDRAGAIGVLEKAESLLGPYPEWRAAAARTLARLRGG